MSHAANLRKYRPQNSLVPSKRRRLSPSSSAAPRQSNGVSNLALPPFSDTKLSALPSEDPKRSRKPRHDEAGVTVLQADDGKDVETSDSSSAADDESEPSDSDSNDEDASEDDGQEHARSSEESEDASDSEGEPVASLKSKPQTAKQDHTTDHPAESDELQDAEEPSFGDLLRSRAPETITVEAPAAEPAATSTSITGVSTNRTLAVPSANSLGTVLAQALKTNDVDLLESCLHVPNLESIRATIERIHPAQATALLQRLAERLHKRPGRAGSLMVWVQWTVVAHGGYLASQPAAMKELRTLYQVVKQRASGLQPLLALKGKLDMLEAQMQLRRNMQSRSRAARQNEEEQGIIYVEGQESTDDSQDEGDARDQNLQKSKPKDKSRASASLSKSPLTKSSDEESGADAMLTSLPNGIGGSDAEHDEEEDEDEEESDEEEGSLIDDEAEETDNDSDELSEEIDYDDVDGVDNDASGSEEEEVEPPSKRARPSNPVSTRRR